MRSLRQAVLSSVLREFILTFPCLEAVPGSAGSGWHCDDSPANRSRAWATDGWPTETIRRSAEVRVKGEDYEYND